MTSDSDASPRAGWTRRLRAAVPRPGGPAARAALLAVLAVGAAYLVQRPVALAPRGLLAAATLSGFHPPEGGHRWSRARSTIVFPDPGPGVPVRVELDLAGGRPRGHAPVRAVLEAAGRRREAALASRVETIRLDTVTRGWWRSDLAVSLESETFRPGAADARDLGARLHAARLVPVGRLVAPRRPPLGQVVASGLAAALLASLAVGSASGRRATWVPPVLALLLGAGYLWARPWMAVAAWPLALAAALVRVTPRLAPGAVARAAGLAAEWGRALREGLRVWARWPTAAVALAAALAVAGAHRARPVVEIDVGSGEEAAVARGLGPFDAAEGATFRAPQPGAVLDLRDLGGGGRWAVDLVVSSATGAPRLPVAASGGHRLEADLTPAWTEARLDLRPPAGWRPGPLLTFPAGERVGLRLDRVRVTREDSLPAARVLLAVLASSLLLGSALAAVGLPRLALPVALLSLAGQAGSQALRPAVATPFAVDFAWICAAGTVLAAGLAGARRGRVGAGLPAAALAAAALGFVSWLAVTSFPLYRGGHFRFQAAVAEEIWKGRFMQFYLPYPGSILSRQEQWGNIVVPNPFLYQTLIAPLAALPRPWFHAGQKVVLALLLSSMTLVTAWLAGRVGGRQAAAWAAAFFATFLPTFQLLGLGHVVTLFGVWAASLFFAFVVARFDRLARPGTWWTATLLLTACFLAYTAALFFTALVLAASVPLLWRGHPRSAGRLAAAGLAASLLAFALYYVHWTWPFLSESLPRLAAGSGAAVSEGDLLVRLAREPSRLAYTFGSVLVPLAGLAGLARLRGAPAPARVVLGAWAGILLAASVLDLFFNLLHKHHYFTMAPVAVGCGLLLAALAERGRAGRACALALCLASAVLGARTALDAALGRIP